MVPARWPLQAPTPLPPSCLGTADILKSSLIIFVMGGPGCGKETQCKNMANKYGFCHMGLGQLLWQKAQQGTRQGPKIHDVMLKGLLVPTVRGPGCGGRGMKGIHREELPGKALWKPRGLKVWGHWLLLCCPEPLCPQL